MISARHDDGVRQPEGAATGQHGDESENVSTSSVRTTANSGTLGNMRTSPEGAVKAMKSPPPSAGKQDERASRVATRRRRANACF